MTKSEIYSGRYVCRAVDQFSLRMGRQGHRRFQPIYQHDFNGGILQDTLMLVEIESDWKPAQIDTIMRRAMLALECGIDDAIAHPDWKERPGDSRTNSQLAAMPYHKDVKYRVESSCGEGDRGDFLLIKQEGPDQSEVACFHKLTTEQERARVVVALNYSVRHGGEPIERAALAAAKL